MRRKKFNPQKIHKLNDPERLKDIVPLYIWEKLPLAERPKTMVDIGAGTGLFTVAFSQLEPEAHIYACDISREMIAWLQEKVVPLHPHIYPLLMEESRLPLPDDCADLVYMINLHHELERPVELLLDCRRVLKKSGTLFIVDWKRIETKHGPPVSWRVSPEEVEAQLSEAGFRPLGRDEGMKNHYLIIAR